MFMQKGKRAGFISKSARFCGKRNLAMIALFGSVH